MGGRFPARFAPKGVRLTLSNLLLFMAVSGLLPRISPEPPLSLWIITQLLLNHVNSLLSNHIRTHWLSLIKSRFSNYQIAWI